MGRADLAEGCHDRTRPVSDKVIPTRALTGARQGKEANSDLPEQPGEIVEGIRAVGKELASPNEARAILR